jgi:hypothetical protein
VTAFFGLVDGPIVVKEIVPGQDGCRGYCLKKDNLLVCDNEGCPGRIHRLIVGLVARRMARG